MMTTSPTGMAATDLGLGGLPQQVQQETDEERKKRLALAAQQKALGPAAQTLGLGSYGG